MLLLSGALWIVLPRARNAHPASYADTLRSLALRRPDLKPVAKEEVMGNGLPFLRNKAAQYGLI